MKPLIALIATLLATPVFAHDGHATFASHWHATDVMGFVAAGGIVAALVWLSGRGK